MYADFRITTSNATSKIDIKQGTHITHIGYISLFPMMLGLISPASSRLDATLNIIRDTNHLWSPWGVLSLSKSDPYFGSGENYWKGPIWINMNYLILSSLYNNYIHNGGSDNENPYREKCQRIYDELRSNLIKNLFEVQHIVRLAFN